MPDSEVRGFDLAKFRRHCRNLLLYTCWHNGTAISPIGVHAFICSVQCIFVLLALFQMLSSPIMKQEQSFVPSSFRPRLIVTKMQFSKSVNWRLLTVCNFQALHFQRACIYLLRVAVSATFQACRLQHVNIRQSWRHRQR